MRLVLDTNVIICALLFDGAPEKLLLSSLSGPHQLILSPYIIIETCRISESKFSVDPSNLLLLQQFLKESEMVYFEPFLSVLADEPDNRILETAVAGRAHYIVTGDKQFLALKSHQTIAVLSIADGLKVLGT